VSKKDSYAFCLENEKLRVPTGKVDKELSQKGTHKVYAEGMRGLPIWVGIPGFDD